MLSPKNQKCREGVQIPFLEKILKENQKTWEQLENNFDETTGKQQERLQAIEKTSKVKSNIAELTKAIEYSKKMEFFRHPNIPQNIPDEHIWNDAWYDEKRNSWVTLNDYFFQLENSRTRDIQVKYEMENIANIGIIIEEEKIQFRCGLPSILQKDDKEQPTWYALPTLYDVMLTKEIVKGTLKPETQENAYLYTTGSESWISVLGRYLTEQEYLFACEFMIGLVKMPLNILRANVGRPYDPKEYKKTMKQWEEENKDWEKQQKKNK
ncbi:MAG: hypothetical protein OEL81_02705 [Nitrosopumilus sp.]|nr:hypothetical protein [Nitrosopumilus sp.]